MTRINELRQEKGFTIKGFAVELGISESLMRKLLYNTRKPSLNVIKRILERFPTEDAGRYL